MKQILSFLLIFSGLISCKAQLPPGEYTSTNKKAIASFQAALKYYDTRQDAKAMEELNKAIERDPNFIEPHLLYAQIHTEANQVQKAIDEYVKALTINPKFDKKVYFNLAGLEF